MNLIFSFDSVLSALAITKVFPILATAILLSGLAMLVLLFSMAGVPPMVGFFGKLYVLQAAYDAARADPAPGEKTVLFSPACASFDQFANFEVRGDAFRELVAQLTP